jgi:hypothetical protein
VPHRPPALGPGGSRGQPLALPALARRGRGVLRRLRRPAPTRQLRFQLGIPRLRGDQLGGDRRQVLFEPADQCDLVPGTQLGQRFIRHARIVPRWLPGCQATPSWESVPPCVGKVGAVLVEGTRLAIGSEGRGRRRWASSGGGSDGQGIQIADGSGWRPGAGQGAEARARIVAFALPPFLGWGEVPVDCPAQGRPLQPRGRPVITPVA